MLFDRFASRALGVAHAVGRDRKRSEDIVQEAFLSIWRSRATYRGELGSVGGWVTGTVRHRALDSLRSNGRHEGRRADAEGIEERVRAPGSVEQSAGERDEATRLRDVLALLPAAQREVIGLAYYGELSTTEIATELSLPLGTVKGRIRLLKYFPGVSPAERLATDTTDVLFLGLVPPDNRANPTLVASMADELAGRIRRASRCSCGASGTARPLLGPSVRWTRLMAQRSVALKRHLSRSLYKRLTTVPLT